MVGAVLDVVERSWSILGDEHSSEGVDGVAVGSDCRHCGVTVPARADYCPECFTPSPVIVSDPAGVESGPDPVEPPVRSRWGLVAGMVMGLQRTKFWSTGQLQIVVQ